MILMTAQASLQSAIQAVNEGAFHYIQKPFRNDELVAIVRRAVEHRQLKVENRHLKREIKRRDKVGKPIGTNRAWLDVVRVAETVAETDSTVLLQGESGTGKGIIARYIHDMSKRARMDSSRSTAARCLKACWRASSLATSKGLSLER